MEVNQKIVEAMVTLLESGIGYSVSLVPELVVRPLHDGTFAVEREQYDEKSKNFHHVYEKIFQHPRAAVEFFEQERIKYELGDDFEH